jgi:NAD-dependent dihydropyrimidine dehydrogenase PreA subunit
VIYSRKCFWRIFMETKMKKKRRAFVNEDDCVACGCCVKVCPRNAIEIWKGIAAKINLDACVGCAKCVKECPASVIAIREVV